MLKLRPYRQVSAKGPQAAMGKLTKRFYGPFQIVELIGKAAYRLKLSEGPRIHPIFHCSLLKSFKGNPEQGSEVALPKCFTQHQPVISLMAILDYCRASEQAPWEVLVQWEGLLLEETSWEDWKQLCADYHLKDKVNFQGPTTDTKTEASTSKKEVKIATTDQEHEARVQSQNTGVQSIGKPKRVITRPSYLNDYI